MHSNTLPVCLLCFAALAQPPESREQLDLLVKKAPPLTQKRRPFVVDSKIGYPSAVAMDRSGLLYVLHSGGEVVNTGRTDITITWAPVGL